MEIIRRGLILPEEEIVAKKLRELPDHWWCIGGDGNRFTFKRGEGTQIDFIVISPKGIFFLDSKNVSKIELAAGNKVKFFNSAGKQIRKNQKRENPVEDILDERYQAKDWLRGRGIEDFLTRDRKDLKVFMHGAVVISNDHNVQYGNCKLEQLNYYSHKYRTLLPISELNQNFFESLHLPPNCDELSQEEMWSLYKIFYNPDMTISQIFSEIRKEEDKLFREKQVYYEKIRLLESENIDLNKNMNELEGTRNNLLAMNKELAEKTSSYEQKLQTESEKVNSLKEIKENLEKETKHYKKSETELDKVRLETDNLSNKIISLKNDLHSQADDSAKKITGLTNENRKLKHKSEKQKSPHQLLFYQIACGVLAILLCTWVIHYIVNMGPIENKEKKKTVFDPNKDTTFSSIEKIYPTIKRNFDNKEYEELTNHWRTEVLDNRKDKKDFTSKDYHQYDLLFYYLAKAYHKLNSPENAVKYYEIFTEISHEDNNKLVIEAYFNRSVLYIRQNKKLLNAYSGLQKAYTFVGRYIQNPNEQYQWQIQILKYLGITFELMEKLPEAQKNEIKQFLSGLSPRKRPITSFYNEALQYYRYGLDLANKFKDVLNEEDFRNHIGTIFMKKEEYPTAIMHFNKTITTLSKKKFAKPVEKQIAAERLITAYTNIGGCYSRQNNPRLAETNYNKALELSQQSNNRIKEAELNLNLGGLFKKQKKLKEALPYLKNAYDIAKELEKQHKITKKDLALYASNFDIVNKLVNPDAAKKEKKKTNEQN